MAAIIVSAMAHGFAVGLLLPSSTGDLGSVDIATSAISVNLETTDVLDASESAAAREAASSPAGAPVEGAKETSEKQEEVEEKRSPPAASENALTADRERVEIVEAEEKKQEKKARQAAVSGGAGTLGAEDAQASAGRISASQGAILNYGAKLRAIISSNTPRNIRKTSVRLAFSIAPLGGLAAASIVTSSGDPSVDKHMLGLLRDLAQRFPQPPDGSSASQLSYNIEIIFR